MFRKLKENTAGFAGAVGVVVASLITITIGVLIYFKVLGSLGGGGSAAQVTALTNLNSTASTVFTLAPIVVIILIASVILGVVMSFGQTPGQ